ncbi:MAG: SDR family oxidoreductase [Candidatus Omnitrophica bacterium]|nr:SDR family oxidoreductase [Candidatus Omnitrophota bacterium]
MKEKKSLERKTCIITGSGKGIGRAAAELFYNHGANLALITRDKQDLISLRDDVGFDDERIFLSQGDVSDEETVKRFIQETIGKFKKIDVLINNAGIRFRKDFLDTTTEEWDQVINNNLNSTYLFSREAGRNMVSRKEGKIVNIVSIVGTLGLPQLSAYGASKGGVITLTKCLALEWAKCNINVNAIAPGFCETSYVEKFRKKEELYKFTIERTPQKKWGTSLDIAEACLFLSTEASKYITGEVLNVDGGWSAW